MTLPPLFSRRELLRETACGFGSVALGGMMHRLSQAASGPFAARQAHVRPRAKRVIFVFLAGGPSQGDLFAPKEYITRHHGQAIASPVGDDGQLRVGVSQFLPMAPVAPVRPRGDSGLMMSDLLPNLAGVADELCMLRAVVADNKAHAPATLQFHTGHIAEARPSIGSWISYGLGTENENLPSFISILPPVDERNYGAGFLPAMHQGTPLKVPRNEGDVAIANLHDPQSTPEAQRRRLDFLQRANQRLLQQVKTNRQMEGIIQSFELAFRMQVKTPGLVDLSGESQQTQEMYGIDDAGGSNLIGRACLMARRFSEAGVRFVQVSLGGWDHHADIRTILPKSCAGVDKPISGLIRDLKRRGLLEDTLVVMSGEFGRTYWSQDLTGTSPIDKHGREHQQESFCTLLAGGGVKPGFVYGETDDHGYQPVEGSVHLHDLHATLLHLLGIDHELLTYRHVGRGFRLTDVYGRVVREVLA